MVTTPKKIVKFFSRSLRKKLPRDIKIIYASVVQSRIINRKYLRKNKPANVLSFRYGPASSDRSPKAKAEYGEILVCPAVIRQEAKHAGVPYTYQMTKMIVHAMVHLAGIHHEKSRKRAETFCTADHGFTGKEKELAKVIVKWIKRDE